MIKIKNASEYLDSSQKRISEDQFSLSQKRACFLKKALRIPSLKKHTNILTLEIFGRMFWISKR